MNVQTSVQWPKPVKLTVDGFRMLKQAGVFAGYSKAELLSGEIAGVRRQPDDKLESDASVPIKLRIEDYGALAKAGLFDNYGKTELIDGVVYEVSPQYRPHGFAKDELAYRLRRCLETLGSPWHVATEQSVAIAPHSEPQPDIALTGEPRGSGPIPAASVALLVEIAASTIRFDLNPKAAIYAAAGVPEYWVVDLNARVVYQLWHLVDGAYATRREVAFGERIEAVTVAGLAVETIGI